MDERTHRPGSYSAPLDEAETLEAPHEVGEQEPAAFVTEEPDPQDED